MPMNRHLRNPDARRRTNHRPVVVNDRRRRRRLSQHEHLDVKDPALSVHVRDNMRQRRAREQLKPALGVADPRRGGRRQALDDEVEALHEDVAHRGALDDRLGADHVAAAADGDAARAGVDDVLARLEQVAQVREAARAVRVGEDDVRAARVPEPVRDGAALAAVLGEGDDAQDVVQGVLAREVEGDFHRAVFAAVVDDEDLVARRRLRGCVVFLVFVVVGGGLSEDLAVAWGRGAAQALAFLVVIVCGGGAAEAAVEVLDGLLESGYYALLFVVGGNHDRDFDLGGLDVAGVGDVEGIAVGGCLGLA